MERDCLGSREVEGVRMFRPLMVSLSAVTVSCVPAQMMSTSSGPRHAKEIKVQGPYRHDPSGAVFPDTLAGLVRGRILSYTPDGRDVGATYDSGRADAEVLISVYVYPRATQPASDLSGHFSELLQSIADYHGAESVGEPEGATVASKGEAGQGLRARLGYDTALGGRVQWATSLVYLFASGEWFVSFRMTYPRVEETTAGAQADRSLEEMGWPGTD